MPPLVSIVIPTYNHAHFLGRALQSVLDQSYPHWEALVVDNHSEDETESVVRSFGDPRFRLLKIHNHGVIAASRNLGMRNASGEWIAFLDSDDRWYPRKLDVIMETIASNEVYDVLSHDEIMVNAKTGATKMLRYGPADPNFYRKLLVEGNRLSTSATVVRRSFIERNNISFTESPRHVSVEDYGFWLDLARRGARFMFVHDVQGEYHIHDTNSSGRVSHHLQNNEALLHDHVFELQRFDSRPGRLWKAVLPRLAVGQSRRLASAGQFGAAAASILKAAVQSPLGTARYLVASLKRAARAGDA